MLATAMTYTRTDTPDFSTRLTREEPRVFTAVQGETGVAAIVAKTRLEPEQVEAALAGLVGRKLIRRAGGDAPEARAGNPSPSPTPPAWHGRRASAEAFLLARLGGDRAGAYIAQLRACSSEAAFAEVLGSLSKRLALIVDAHVGAELLTFRN